MRTLIYFVRMKTRKNLLLSKDAVAKGERLAALRATSLSRIIEEQLLSITIDQSEEEEYWVGPPLQPIARPGDRRHEYLKRKHR